MGRLRRHSAVSAKRLRFEAKVQNGRMELKLLALVPNSPMPVRAPAATRERVPRGYGVQEQCLPFTAASASGPLVPAPFDFGLCAPSAVPALDRAFHAPEVARGEPDERVFYVVDRPQNRFLGNAYAADPSPLWAALASHWICGPSSPASASWAAQTKPSFSSCTCPECCANLRAWTSGSACR